MTVSPLLKIAEHFSKARNKEVIRFSEDAALAVHSHLSDVNNFSKSEVEAIVSAIDLQPDSLCNRLDAAAMKLESLHQGGSVTRQTSDPKNTAKMELGAAALVRLIDGFVKVGSTEETRRWHGVLALELLLECPSNKTVLESSRNRSWKQLADVITHGKCQVLKLLAGSMIRELQSLGMTMDDFWINGSDRETYSHFPRGEHHDSQWVVSFEDFMEQLHQANALTQDKCSVTYAHSVNFGEWFTIQDQQAILVTVSTDLNIVISTLDSAPALYVDVPLTNIQNIRLEKKPASPESQELMWGIAIDLSSLDQSTFYVNAAGRSDAVITLAFDGQSSANGLKRIIEARILEHPTAQLLQRSLQGQSESDELSDPSSDKNYDSPHQSSQSRPQNLVVTALRASMSIPPAPEAEMNPSLRPQPEQKVVMRSTDNIEPYDINTQLSLQNTETSQPQSQRLEYGNSRGSQNYGLSNVASFKGASFRYQVDSNVLATPEGPTLLQQSLDPIVMSPSLVRDKSNDAARLLLSENPKSLGEEDLKHDVGMRNERYRSPGKDGAFRNIETEYMGTPNSEDGTHHGYDTSTRNGRDPSGNDDSDEISDKDYNQHEDEAENFAEPREFQITDQDLQHDQGTLKNEWKADERQVQKVPRAKLSRQLRDADGNSVDLATAATERPIGLSTQMNTPKVKSRAVAPGKQSEMTDLYRLGNRSAKDIEDEYRLPSSSPIRAPEKKSKAKVLSKTPRTKAAGKGVSAAPPTKKSSSKTANFRSKPAAKRAGAESKPTKNTSHENEVPLTLEVRGMENDDDHQNEGIQIEADKTKPVPQAIRPSIQQKNEPKKAPISKVPQKRQSNVPSTKPNSPGLASVEPRHNRPRRAAALTAKKKIRGLDMADDIVDDGDDHFIDQQLSASSQNLMPPPPNKSKAQDFTRPTPNEEKYSKSGLASKSPHPVSQRQVKKPFAMSEEHASSTRDDIVSGSSEKVMIIPSVQRTEKDDKRLPQITPLQKKDESTVRSQPPESPFWGQNVERAEKLLPEEITSSTNQIDDTTETTIEFGLDTLADCVSTASRHDKPQAAQGNVNKPSRIIENIGHAKRPIKPPLDAAEVSFPSNIGSKDLAKPVEQLEGDLKANSELESAENPPIIPNDPASLRRSLAKNIGDPSQLKDPFSEKLNRVVNQGQSHQHQHANTSTSQEKGTNPAEIRQRDELLDPASMQHGSSAIDPPLQTVDEDDTPFPLVLSPSHVPSVPPNGKRKTTTQPANTRSKRHKITSAEDAGIATVAATSHAGATTPLVGPTQKPELISFGASGPKNQGTISAKKVGIDAEFQALDAKARRSLNQATLKRRQQDIAASERVSRAPKRQQMSMINKNAENSNAVLQELDTAILSQKERKPSSQSTRVDENGSPIPFNSPRPDPFASQQSEKNDSKIKQMFSDAQLNEDDGYVVQGGGLGEIDHSLPFTHESLMPQARHVTFGRVSSNTKQAPSSPIAPSAFTLIPAHQIYSNGEVVDTKTRKPILPSNPQDPFLDFGRERKSDFMKKLRKASAFAPFRQNHASEKNATRKIEALKAGQHRSPARRVPVTEQDPEKTLIGTDRPTARKRHCEISNSSISSQTVYSEDAMGSGKISGNDSERGSLDEWHSALKPHQTNVLTMLLEIANRQTRHLVSKEEAISDMILYYGRVGEALIDQYVGECQKSLNAYNETTNEMKSSLATIYRDSIKTVQNISRGASKLRDKETEKTWSKYHASLTANVNAALKLCNE